MAKQRAGLLFEDLVPGAFYQGVTPGGFTDASTGMHIPGPKVNLDAVNKRQVVSVSDLPDPVQLPHKKEVLEFKDKDRKVRDKAIVPFDRRDEYPFHEGFQMALSTGVIAKIEDEDVEKYYPEAWKNRQSEIVYTNEISVVPMGDLIRDAQERSLKERARALKADQTATEIAGGGPAKKHDRKVTDNPAGGTPPPPPPPA